MERPVTPRPRRRPGPRLRAGASVLGTALLLCACSGPDSTSTRLEGAGAATASPSATAPGSPGATAPASPTTAPASPSTAPVSPTTTAPAPSVASEEAATADVIATHTLPPVPVRAEGRFGEGLVVRVTSVQETNVTAVYPGEVSGPGMVVQLTFTNGSPDVVDLDGIRVTASRPDGTPAPSMEGAPAAPPKGLLEPGATAGATFVYSIPRGTSRSMTLEITSISSDDVVTVDV